MSCACAPKNVGLKFGFLRSPQKITHSQTPQTKLLASTAQHPTTTCDSTNLLLEPHPNLHRRCGTCWQRKYHEDSLKAENQQQNHTQLEMFFASIFFCMYVYIYIYNIIINHTCILYVDALKKLTNATTRLQEIDRCGLRFRMIEKATHRENIMGIPQNPVENIIIKLCPYQYHHIFLRSIPSGKLT